MFIIKNTTDIPHDVVNQAVNFSKGLLPTTDRTLTIFVYNTQHKWRGTYCYTHLYVNLGRNNKYPIHHPSRFKTCSNVVINSKIDLLVWLLSHELYHHRQDLLRKRFSELDADLYAASRLHQYQSTNK